MKIKHKILAGIIVTFLLINVQLFSMLFDMVSAKSDMEVMAGLIMSALLIPAEYLILKLISKLL